MKQRITVKELEKLTDDQMERLREWWNPQQTDHVIKDDKEYVIFLEGIDNHYAMLVFHGKIYEVDHGFDKKNYSPLLSIGQMIQFIQDKKPLLKGISKNRFDKWFVNIDNGMLGYKDELCDALWESVQQILKQP